MKHTMKLFAALALLLALALSLPVVAEEVVVEEPVSESTDEVILSPDADDSVKLAPEIDLFDGEVFIPEENSQVEAAPDEAEANSAVEAQPKAASAIPSKLTLGVKETYKIDTTGMKGKITYKSSKTKIATVSKKGVIKAKKAGKAKITITPKKGKKKTITVTVKKAPSKISLDDNSVTMEIDDTFNLFAELPTKTASYKTTWSSSKPSVVKITYSDSDYCEFKALKAGTAVITAKTFNGKKATCKVTVKGDAESEDDHRSYELRDYLGKSLDTLNNDIPDKLQNLRNKYFSVDVEDGIITGINIQHQIPLVEGGAKYQLFILSPGMEYNDSTTRFMRFALWKVYLTGGSGVVQSYILRNDSFPSYSLQIMVINGIIRQVYMYKY